MTYGRFKERELKAPGYLGGIYILGWATMGRGAKRGAEPADPQEARKRASGDRVAIQFKYGSNQLGLSNKTVRDALHQRKM